MASGSVVAVVRGRLAFRVADIGVVRSASSAAQPAATSPRRSAWYRQPRRDCYQWARKPAGGCVASDTALDRPDRLQRLVRRRASARLGSAQRSRGVSSAQRQCRCLPSPQRRAQRITCSHVSPRLVRPGRRLSHRGSARRPTSVGEAGANSRTIRRLGRRRGGPSYRPRPQSLANARRSFPLPTAASLQRLRVANRMSRSAAASDGSAWAARFPHTETTSRPEAGGTAHMRRGCACEANLLIGVIRGVVLCRHGQRGPRAAFHRRDHAVLDERSERFQLEFPRPRRIS